MRRVVQRLFPFCYMWYFLRYSNQHKITLLRVKNPKTWYTHYELLYSCFSESGKKHKQNLLLNNNLQVLSFSEGWFIITLFTSGDSNGYLDPNLNSSWNFSPSYNVPSKKKKTEPYMTVIEFQGCNLPQYWQVR